MTASKCTRAGVAAAHWRCRQTPAWLESLEDGQTFVDEFLSVDSLVTSRLWLLYYWVAWGFGTTFKYWYTTQFTCSPWPQLRHSQLFAREGISRAWLQQIGPALVSGRLKALLPVRLARPKPISCSVGTASFRMLWSGRRMKRSMCTWSVTPPLPPHLCTLWLFHFFGQALILYLESYRKERCAKVLLRYYAKGALSGLDVVWRTSYDWSQPGSSSGSQAQESWPDSGMS